MIVVRGMVVPLTPALSSKEPSLVPLARLRERAGVRGRRQRERGSIGSLRDVHVNDVSRL